MRRRPARWLLGLSLGVGLCLLLVGGAGPCAIARAQEPEPSAEPSAEPEPELDPNPYRSGAGPAVDPASVPRRSLAIRRRRGPIAIDGRLDEEDWAQAEVADGFTERLPRTGAIPPVETEVRLLYDRTALYVGVTCFTEEGEEPRALTLTRDSGRIWSDDAVTLKFDVRHDRRNTVGFATNPAGAQLDFIALDNGRAFRIEYDAVWEVATSRSERAWHAEFRIPTAALGLPPGQPSEGGRIFGFELSRDHNARQATYDLRLIPPEFGAMSAQHYAEAHGAEEIGGGRPLVLIPYTLVTWPGRARWGMELEPKAGMDLRLRLADDVWGEITTLTDFAEVDLDAQRVNLDRFPLFFPERRPFFLTGLDVFAFGIEEQAQLFFTRRIGLDASGQPVPILGGLKIYGREGNLGFGLLDVVTAATAEQEAANWGLLRLRYNLGEASYVGIFLGNRSDLPGDWLDAEGFDADPHLSAGVDGLVRLLDGRLELRGFGAYTRREGVEEDRSDFREGLSGQLQARWRGQQWMPSVSALWLERGFNPELGFLRRPAIFQADATVPWLTRNPLGGIRTISLEANGQLQMDDALEELLRLSAGWKIGLELSDTWSFELEGSYVQDVVRADFELVPGLTIPAGEYRGARIELEVYSPYQRNPGLELTLAASNAFFGGASYTADLTVAAFVGSHFRMELSATGALLDFYGRDLIPTLAANTVFSVTPDPYLVIDLVGQLNSVAERFIAMLRLRWRFLPGSDLFLVYRERLDYAGGVLESERRITLKISYRFDVVL